MERPRIPLVLGVVGHRALRGEDPPALEASLVAVLSEFRTAHPQSPIVLLAALAEGADLLAAEVALGAGATVRAPLPMPAAAYRASTSFSSDESRARFDAALARVESFVVPLPEMPTSDAEWLTVATGQGPVERDRRHACYANAGVYIARHCHALIALWDGEGPDPAHPSGTAEIVRFMLEGEPPAEYPWKSSQPLGFRGDRGPVVVLHTPRAGTAGAVAGARDVRLPASAGGLPSGERLGDVPLAARVSSAVRFGRRALSAMGMGHTGELRQFRETCQVVDDFNRDVACAGEELEKRLGADPVSGRAGAWLQRINDVRAAAGLLAERLDKRLHWAINSLFALLLLAVFFLHLYAHWFRMEAGHPAYRPLFLWLFLAALVAAAMLVVVVWWKRLDQRRLDYRALAEALRVRHAWALAGIDISVADSYLDQLRGEMAWARRALLHVCPPPRVWRGEFTALGHDAQVQRLEQVGKDWVEGQQRFFQKRHRTNHRKATLLRTGGFVLAVAGWLLAAALLFADTRHPDHFVLILSGLLVVCAGVFIAICERRSHEELAKQYERMLVVFRNGSLELQKRLTAGDIAGAHVVLTALGREAVAEHAQWLILRRARGFELHVG